MTCEELRDLYELYALGVLEDAEANELRAHLAKPGDPCVEGVRIARGMVAALAFAAPSLEPPARLRKRVLALAKPAPAVGMWSAIWAAAAACLLGAAIWLGARERQEGAALEQARAQSASQAKELAHLNEILAFVNDPAARPVTFGKGAPRPPQGKVFVNPDRGVLLMASNLSPAPAGKIYEMWLIPKKGNPLPAGLFQAQPDESAVYIRRGPFDLAATAAVAVTLEPEGGTPAPTTKPLIVAAL